MSSIPPTDLSPKESYTATEGKKLPPIARLDSITLSREEVFQGNIELS